MRIGTISAMRMLMSWVPRRRPWIGRGILRRATGMVVPMAVAPSPTKEGRGVYATQFLPQGKCDLAGLVACGIPAWRSWPVPTVVNTGWLGTRVWFISMVSRPRLDGSGATGDAPLDGIQGSSHWELLLCGWEWYNPRKATGTVCTAHQHRCGLLSRWYVGCCRDIVEYIRNTSFFLLITTFPLS